MRALRIAVIASLATGVAPLSSAAQDHASPGGVGLSVVRIDGSDACPDASVIARDVSHRLGRDPFVGDVGRVVEVAFLRASGGYQARLFVREPTGALIGQRELSADDADCTALADSVALALALVIDPDAVMRIAESSSSPPVGSSPRSSSPPSEQSTSSPAPASSCPPAVVAPPASRVEAARGSAIVETAVRPVVAIGLVPRWSPGAALVAHVRTPWPIAFEASLMQVAGQRTTDEVSGYSLTAFTLAACGELALTRRLRGGLCAGAMGGVIDTVVFALQPLHPGARAWGAVEAGARFTASIFGPLFLELAAEAVFPLVRYEFVVVGHPGVAFQQSAVTAVGSIGLGVAF